jgi:hypothetical protein
MKIKSWNRQNCEDRDRRHPASRIANQVLAHCMRRIGLHGCAVRDGQSEGASRNANRQPANCQHDDEHAPERLPILRQLIMP